VKHFASEGFWKCYDALPVAVRDVADRNFQVLKVDPRHPSLHFKQVSQTYWSARVGLSYRALARRVDDDFIWFWIGTHAEYDRLLRIE